MSEWFWWIAAMATVILIPSLILFNSEISDKIDARRCGERTAVITRSGTWCIDSNVIEKLKASE